MSTLAKAARAAHAKAVAYKPNERGGYSFYCCNALAHEAMRMYLPSEERNRLEDLFDELFGDAAFWVGTDSSCLPRPTCERDWVGYPEAAWHADRIDVLGLFATILESGDD
jgi:hypothetical protein